MNKKARKYIALILVLIMAMGLVAACGSSDDPAPAAGGDQTAASPSATPSPQTQSGAGDAPGQVTILEAEEPEEGANLAEHINVLLDLSGLSVVNPHALGGTAGSSLLWNLVGDRLMEIYGPGDYRPGLAHTWETEDYMNITLHLRDDVYFHNGDKFTAEDVAFTIQYALDNPGGTAWTRLRFIESFNIIDDYTIVVTYGEKNVDYEFELSHWSCHIINKRAHDLDPDDQTWAAVGTGPYVMTSFSPANVATLERNENFWGEMPPTKSITFWTVPEMATRRIMLQNGEAQLAMGGMNPEDSDALNADPDFNVIGDRSTSYNYIAFNNMGDAIMMDTNFRLAVAHSINREDVAMVAGGNWAVAWPSGTAWSTGTPHFLDLPRREYDPDLAKEYLAQSVYNGETLELGAQTGPIANAAELVQVQLAAVGIDVEIVVMDTPSFTDAYAYNPESTRQLSMFGHGFSPTVLGSLRALFYQGANTNRANLNDPLVNEVTERLASETDPNVVRDLTHQVQQHLYETVFVVPLWSAVTVIPTVRGIGGLHLWGDFFRYNFRGLYWDLNETPEHLLP